MVLELRRKILHSILAILFALCAPLFPYHVLIACGAIVFVFFLIVRSVGISDRIASVPRITFGELFFAIGVLGATSLSYPDIALFQVSMMILAVADPLAALVGTRFGKHAYVILDERRSLEGSLACLIGSLAVLVIFHIPLILALTVSCALTVIEAFSLRGSDNLFLPLSAIAMLQFLL